MKKLFATVSSLLLIMGLKAQTTVTAKKETTPQVKPVTRQVPVVKPGVTMKEGSHTIKTGTTVADSLKAGIKQTAIKHEGIKQTTIKQTVPVKQQATQIKFDNQVKPHKDAPIKN